MFLGRGGREGGREADEVLLPGERGALRGMGRAGGGGESREEEEGEGFPLACRALSPRESVERGAGDNGQTG